VSCVSRACSLWADVDVKPHTHSHRHRHTQSHTHTLTQTLHIDAVSLLLTVASAVIQGSAAKWIITLLTTAGNQGPDSQTLS